MSHAVTPLTSGPLAPEIVDQDITCTQCGYNLRTLARSAHCPECGRPIMDSAPGPSHRVARKLIPRAVVRELIKLGLPSLIAGTLTLVAGLGFGLWFPGATIPFVIFLVFWMGMTEVTILLLVIKNARFDDIYIGADVALNRSPFAKDVRLKRDEVTRILESRLEGLLLRTANPRLGFGIMPETEGYNEIRAVLSQWRPIEPDRWLLARLAGLCAAWTAGLFSMVTLMIGRTAEISMVAGSVAIGLIGWHTFRCLRNPVTTIGRKIYNVGICVLAIIHFVVIIFIRMAFG